MTPIDITATPEKWRKGDWATVTWPNGATASGPLEKWPTGSLGISKPTVSVRYTDGTIRDGVDIRVTREAPSLPTEPGSVIRWKSGTDRCVAIRNAFSQWPWTVNQTQYRLSDDDLLDLIGDAVWEQAFFPSDEVTS